MKFQHPFVCSESTDSYRVYRCDCATAIISAEENFITVTILKENNSVNEEKASATDAFSVGDIDVQVDLNNFIISYYKNGRRLFADRAPLAYNLDREFGEGVYHYITREKSEKIYGLGDKGGALNKAGRSFKIDTTDSMGYDGETSDPLYKHAPFYICENSVGCYGIAYHTTAPAVIDCGREHNNYYEPYKYFHTEEERLRYTVYFGTKLAILKAFANRQEASAFPPKWSFDYCGSTMAYTDAPNAYEEMLGFIEKLKEYDLSCRGFYLSSGYTSIGNQRCVFHWNTEKFPNPKKFIEVFKENGIEIIPNIKPMMLVTHPMYDELAEKGYFIQYPDGTPFVTQLWDNLGSYLDFTNPATCKWWKLQVTEKLLDLGITSTWNDNNEFDIQDSDAVAYDASKAVNIRPALTERMVKASYEAQVEKYPRLRPFLSTRSGPPTIRQYAQTWSGDNFTSFKDLRYCHYIGLTMTLSGYYFYGHDLGGFSGDMPSRELLLRWLQHGLFEPRFTIHSWNADGSATMPWSYPDIMPSVRAIFAQRKQLTPYLYNCAYEAVEKELPLNAPLFLYYDDEECEKHPDTMMVGRDILAAFVFDEGIQTATAYLPKADDWYLDGTLYDGGQTVDVTIPAESAMKYFVRAGSVISTDEAAYGFRKGEEIVLTVYPKKNGTFESDLFFDDGLTFDYRNNLCTKLHITVECTDDTVNVSIVNSGKRDTAYTVRLCDGDNRTMLIK